jgi:hypothetical protein
MKTKVCNQLNTHLDLCVKMFGHNFFDFGDHLVYEAIATLRKKIYSEQLRPKYIDLIFMLMFFCSKF